MSARTFKKTLSFVASLSILISSIFYGVPLPLFDTMPTAQAMAVGPGGVGANLNLWLKADQGTSSTTDTDPLASWTDSLTSNVYTQGTGSWMPTYRNNNIDNVNFNPVVRFDGSDDEFSFNQDLLSHGATEYTFVSIYKTIQNEGTLVSSAFNINGSDRGVTFAAGLPNDSSIGNSQAVVISSGDITANNNTSVRSNANSFSVNQVHLATAYKSGTGGVIRKNAEVLPVSGNGLHATVDMNLDDVTYIGSGKGDKTWTPNFGGDMVELIAYEDTPSSTELQQIEGYLALKYGIDLDNSAPYKNSAGTTLWDAVSNTNFPFNTFGIGRDDASGLDQRVSTSINTGTILTVALDDDFTSANTATGRTTAFGSDLEFVMFSDNNGSTTTQTSELPAGFEERIGKEWNITKFGAGAADDLHLQFSGFDGVADGWHLIRSTSADFTTGTITDLGALDANGEITVTNAQLPSNAFTLAKPLAATAAPGGVGTNLNLWLKANEGVTNTGDGTDATAWNDQSMSSYDFTDVGAASYLYRESGLNFNPTIDNPDGTDRRLANGNIIDLQTVSIVTIPDNPDNCDGPFGERAADDENIRTCGTVAQDGDNWELPGNPNAFGNGGEGWFNGSSAVNPAHNNMPNILTVEAPSAANFANGVELGDDHAPGGIPRFWHGGIAEVIAYSDTNNTLDQQKIESYLALKYGITLDQTSSTDYFGSNCMDATCSTGTIMWDASQNANYKFDIAGIGQDDGSALDQRISKSVNDDSLITIASTNNFVLPNNDGSRTSLGDGNFLTWSNNDGGTIWTTTGAPNNRRVVNRKWQAQETGTVGSVFVRVPSSMATDSSKLALHETNVYLLVDVDDNFASGSRTAREQEITLTLNGNYFEGMVDFTDGDFFTLATNTNAFPGSIASNIQLWLDSSDIDGDGNDANQPADGEGVATWVNKAGPEDATQKAGQNAAIFETDPAELINGRPVLKFNGVSAGQGSVYEISGMDTDPAAMPESTVFTVYKPKTTSTFGAGQSVWGNDDGTWDRFFYSFWGANSLGADGVDDGVVGGVNGATLVTDAGAIDEVYLLTSKFAGVGITDASEVYFNGDLVQTFTEFNSSSSIDFHVGWDGDGGPFDGQIAEVLLYNRALDNCEIEQINTYLGDKYGRDFGGIADAYNHGAPHIDNINGIGILPSDCGGNNQINSMYSAELFIDNPSSNDVLNETLTFGNDGGAVGTPSTQVPVGYDARQGRAWRVDEDGDLGTVDAEFDLTALGLTDQGIDKYALLIDTDDGDFTNATVYPGSDIATTGYTYANNKVKFLGVDFNHGDYFAIAVADTSQPTITIEQANGQTDPETATEIVKFTAVFSEPILNDSFICGDVTIGGTATATCTSVDEVSPNDQTAYEITATATTDGTVVPTLASSVVTDIVGNSNTASTSIDNSVTVNLFDSVAPTPPTVNPITTTTDPVTGTAEPGSTVNVSPLTCDITPVVADAAGNWSCVTTTSLPLTAPTTVTVTTTDPAGNTSDPTTTVVTDASTTNAPTINPVDDNDTEVTGTAQPGATISVNPTCDNAPVIADALGNWTCNITTSAPLTDGSTVSATATLAPNATSPATTTAVTDAATGAPTPPTVNPTDGDPVTGTANPGATITIIDPATSNTVCTTTAHPTTGVFSCSPVSPAPTDGQTLNVIQTTTNGTSAPAVLTVDQSAPTPPTVNPITTTTDPVTGTAEPGSTVNVSPLTCDITPVVADAAGNWSCVTTTSLPLTAPTTVTVTTTDPAGNTSDPTVTVIDDPTDAIPAPPVVNPTTGDPVTGTGNPGDVITVYSNPGGVVLCQTSVLPNGTFSCSPVVPAPNPGDTLDVTTTDPSTSNESPATMVTVIDSTDHVEPPVVNPTLGMTVSGTAGPNEIIQVIDPATGNILCTTVADGAGEFSCDVSPDLTNGQTVNVVANDGAGNTSAPTPVTANIGDGDGDGVDDTEEAVAPNGGDGNNDGIPDSQQPAVITISNPVTSQPTTLEVTGGNCQVIDGYDIGSESSQVAQESAFNYPIGLFDFELYCTRFDQVTDVTFYLDQVYDTADWTWRKINRNTGVYTDFIGTVTYSTANIGGTAVTTVNLGLQDNNGDDEDTVSNARILDPSGPAVSSVVTVGGSTAGASSGGSSGGGGRPTAPENVVAPSNNINQCLDTFKPPVGSRQFTEQNTLQLTMNNKDIFYNDVSQPDWFMAAIAHGTEETALNGFRNDDGSLDGTFRPGTVMTRAHFLKMIVAVADIEVVAETSPQLWYVPFQDGAITAGSQLAASYNATTIHQPVSRMEVAQLIMDIMKFDAVDNSFSYFSDIQPDLTVTTNFNTLRDQCVILGDDDSENNNGQRTVRSSSSLLRAEGAAIISRLILIIAGQ